MTTLKLKKILRDSLDGAERVAIVGVGSELRADDVAGTFTVEELSKSLDKKKTFCKFCLLQGCTAPENLTGEIKKFKPSHLMMIDAADLDSRPGTVSFIKLEDLAGASFSTHMMPLEVMVNYIRQSVNCKIIMIGIQPKVLEFGKPFSKEVKSSALELAKTIAEVLTDKKS